MHTSRQVRPRPPAGPWPFHCQGRLHESAARCSDGLAYPELAIGLVTAVVCLGLGLALGKLDFAPKWPELAWLWALNNLLVVALTEEAVFRGYLQEAVSRRFAGRRRYGEVVAVGIAAMLFGVAHAAGGIAYVLVAGLAGVGYGLAYRAGGLHAAMLAHFGLNLAHFTLFTYPPLAG